MHTELTTVVEGPRGPLRLHRVLEPCAAHIRAAVKDLACDDAKGARFPGPNPVSLDTGHFAALRAQPYYVCEKTDGVRFLLVCCLVRGPGGETYKTCALVDRALCAYLLPLRHVPKAMFQGSLLDGELAWNAEEGAWDYLVFDAVCISGVPVLNDDLRARLGSVHRVLGVYARDPRDPVVLRAKSFVSCSKIGELDAHLAGARRKYAIDGIVLTPAQTPVVYGRHNGMFKLKFDARHTVDFMVGRDGMQLLVFDAGRHVPVGVLSITAAPGCIAECAANPATEGLWDLVTVRTDKTTANDMVTFKKTLLNMRENLSLDDVKRVFVTE